MPKKRTFNFKTLQGSSSSSSNQAGNNGADKKPATVNERLGELRKAEGKDAAKKKRELAEAVSQQHRPHQLLRFSRMTGIDHNADGRPSSLFHICLKTTAEQWMLFDDEDLPALAELPLRIRLRLLSYLGFYGPPIGIPVLEALTAGTEPVDQLDLAGLIGHGGLTLHRLVKFLKQQASKATEEAPVETIAESWDQDDSFEAALTPQPSVSRFSQLTHLCLSHPPVGPSWQDLLSLSKHLPSLTHLSLAYWPRPTLTPNLATTTVASQHSPDVSAGGSHYYSGIDNDLSEPASILRQLSGNLLRLQWLDLEGCTEWVQALAYEHIEEPNLRHDELDGSLWPTTPPVTTIFAHNWKNLQYINFAQGWLPTVPAMQGLPKQTMPFRQRAIAEDYLRSTDVPSIVAAEVEEDIYQVEKRRAEIWLQIEDRAVQAAKKIAQTRRAHACRHIAIDHGWEKRAA